MSNFDRIAEHYRWMETLSFGQKLQECRTFFLSELKCVKSVLIFGEGDGRFLSELLRVNPEVQVDVVDGSGAMLSLATRRIADLGAAEQVRTFHLNALNFQAEQNYDAIVTNFFLDCLTQEQVETLVARTARHLDCGGLWIVGDFAIPKGKARIIAQLLVKTLYMAFRLLTGLSTNRLPSIDEAMRKAGFQRLARHSSLFGILMAELWVVKLKPGEDHSVTQGAR